MRIEIPLAFPQKYAVVDFSIIVLDLEAEPVQSTSMNLVDPFPG